MKPKLNKTQCMTMKYVPALCFIAFEAAVFTFLLAGGFFLVKGLVVTFLTVTGFPSVSGCFVISGFSSFSGLFTFSVDEGLVVTKSERLQ